MLRELYRRRALIWAFASRDFATRYRSSVMGWVWSLLQPLATLLVFSAVFSVIFRIQAPPLGSDPERSSFAAFLFTGMVTYNLFSSLLILSMTQLKGTGDLLRKVHFPAWTPILGATIVQLVQVALELIVLIGMYVWLGNIGFSWLLAVPILLGAAMFGQGLGLMLSVFNARYGDIQYAVQVVLQAIYFLTPIIYPLSLVQETSQWVAVIVEANPLTWFVSSMHQVMYLLEVPEWWVVPGLVVLGFSVFWIGFSVFNRTSEDIGEYL